MNDERSLAANAWRSKGRPIALLRSLPRLLLLVVLATSLQLVEFRLPSGLSFGAVAFADDDDGGDDDGDDGGGSVGGRSSGSRGESSRSRPARNFLGGALRGFFSGSPKRRTVRRAPARAAVPLPDRSPIEIIALGLTSEQVGLLAQQGFDIIERDPLSVPALEIVKFRVPQGLTLESARQLIQTAAPAAAVDFNHHYRPGEGAICDGRHCAATGLIGWPLQADAPASCGREIVVGAIDTAINPGHQAFETGQVEVIRLSDETLPESDRQHGTAVAALLVGASGGPAPGLLPGARLIAVDTFYRASRRDDRSDAYDLARALDLLADRSVDVVNMSLSGPDNAVLERMIRAVDEGDTVLVAAAGNRGPKAAPAYPAAYEQVIAVTAIDARKRAYRRAGQGEHIDLAAPGVEVWTAASIRGARTKTGTSFAAPFVTAAVALMKSSGVDKVDDIHRRLAGAAEDLGAPGRDPVFGWGLLNASAACVRPGAAEL